MNPATPAGNITSRPQLHRKNNGLACEIVMPPHQKNSLFRAAHPTPCILFPFLLKAD